MCTGLPAEGAPAGVSAETHEKFLGRSDIQERFAGSADQKTHVESKNEPPLQDHGSDVVDKLFLFKIFYMYCCCIQKHLKL